MDGMNFSSARDKDMTTLVTTAQNLRKAWRRIQNWMMLMRRGDKRDYYINHEYALLILYCIHYS
jgi:hypothetical protein